jgi:hypothetical protein
MEKTITLSLATRQLGAIRNVQNLASPRSGRDVPNQFELICENVIAFQSYGTLIAIRMNGGFLYLTDSHDCSKTTSKYATQWTGWSTAERRRGLESGKFIRIVED